MSRQFVLRFDDICPAMNWEVWSKIEPELIQRGLKPILAVVPDNQDATLTVGEAVPDFWDRVRAWQALGWTIGLHGYEHRYVTSASGIIGLNDRSEFAGLSRDEQLAKIRAGLAIFARERVKADVWIAPSHSFDRTTIDVLLSEGLPVISDGFARKPFTRFGAVWVPQQLWNFRQVGSGAWTVCFHHNPWKPSDLDAFIGNLTRFEREIVSMPAALAAYPPRQYGFLDQLFDRGWRLAMWSKQRVVRGVFRRLLDRSPL